MRASEIVLQVVTVEWSKRSRGGSGARTRAPLVAARTLPSRASPTQACIHSFRHEEADGFAPTTQIWEGTLGEIGLGRPWTRAGREAVLPSLTLRMRDDELHVHFVPSPYALPRRRTERAFSLSEGTWGRVTLNERFGGAYEWLYAQHLVSIAWRCAWATSLFTATLPSKRFQRLADLR
jgi:hypothetical protein